jgi:hypothetical protein
VETQLRALLYNQLEGRKVNFNPVEPEPFDLVDLSKDVTNATRIYHLRTECVREALEGASLIVADSQPLANAVRQVLPSVMIAALPFGRMKAEGGRMKEENIHPSSFSLQPLTIGLLNHDGATEMNNAYALKWLKILDQPLLVFGHTLPGIEAETEEDFSQFAQKCDIVLLPSLPGALNSPTVPLALMESGTAVLAHNAPGYYELSAATGVQLLPADPTAWRKMLDLLASQPAKLRVMQERNRAFAVRTNRESFSRLASVLPPTVAAPRPVLTNQAKDCGCKKRRSASTRPVQIQPNSEKET